jgi:hypothetical protein
MLGPPGRQIASPFGSNHEQGWVDRRTIATTLQLNWEVVMSSNAEMMRGIAEAGKAAGAIRHAFAGGDDEILVIDEWPDEGSFQRFYESQPEIPRLMQEAGVKSAPQISFYRKLDTRDAF